MALKNIGARLHHGISPAARKATLAHLIGVLLAAGVPTAHAGAAAMLILKQQREWQAEQSLQVASHAAPADGFEIVSHFRRVGPQYRPCAIPESPRLVITVGLGGCVTSVAAKASLGIPWVSDRPQPESRKIPDLNPQEYLDQRFGRAKTEFVSVAPYGSGAITLFYRITNADLATSEVQPGTP